MLHYTEAVVRPPWIHEETYALAADRRPFFNSSVRNHRPFDQRIRVPDIATVCHRRPAPASKRDRKSTRLNSSHLVISYAVFCLKKKRGTLNSYTMSCRLQTPPMLSSDPSRFTPPIPPPRSSSLCTTT